MAVKQNLIECRDSSDETRLNHIKRVLETIEQQKQCSVNSERIKLCEKIVTILGITAIPSAQGEYLPFMKLVEDIKQDLVNAIVEQDMVFATLHALYNEISNPAKQASPTLSIVLQLIRVNDIPMAVKWILQNRHNESSLKRAFNTLCLWLTKWTFTPNLGPLVFEFIIGLESEQHFDILINVTLNHIESLFRMVVLKDSRHSLIRIVLHMLSSMLHSPVAFHKVIPMMMQVLEALKHDYNEKSQEALHDLITLCYALMDHFPNYPINDELAKVLALFDAKNERKSTIFFNSWSERGTNVVTIDYAADKVGLNNLGNTCYMNSVLQALYMTKTFRNEMLLNNAGGIAIIAKMQNLFALLQFSGRSSLSPSEILSIARPPGFQPGHQHDSSEFLGYLLDALHEQELSLHGGHHVENHISAASPSNHHQQLTTVKRSFGGRTVTVSQCKQCGTRSERLDTFRDLQLSFPSQSSDTNLSVQSLLDYYLQPENLCGDNQYHCDSCGGLSDGERVTRIAEAPPRLVLTLKHFRYDPATQSRTKILQRVQLDNSLTMEQVQYTLYATVVHCGSSVDSGHYYTYAKDSGDWYKFNDCFVTKSSASELCALRPPEAPYILFYSRIDCDDGDSVNKLDLSQRLLTILRKDDEERRMSKRISYDAYNNRSNSRGGDPGGDDPPPPNGGCGGGGLIDSTQNRFVC